MSYLNHEPKRIDVDTTTEADEWLEEMALRIDIDEMNQLTQAVYVSTVIIAVAETLTRLWPNSGNQPFRDVLSAIDQQLEPNDEKLLPDDSLGNFILEEGCRYTSQRWSMDHTDSLTAMTVFTEGLYAPLITHAELIGKMYQDWQERKGIEPPKSLLHIHLVTDFNPKDIPQIFKDFFSTLDS